MAPKPRVVCVVDDDEAVRDSLQVLLLTRGFAVRTYESAKTFLADVPSSDCLCLLVDMHMPGMTGLALLDALRGQGLNVPAVIITGGGDQALSGLVERAGALGLLRKPVTEGELFSWVDRAMAAGESGCGGAYVP